MTMNAEARVATVVTDVATTTALLPLLVPLFSLPLLPCYHHYDGQFVLLQQPFDFICLSQKTGLGQTACFLNGSLYSFCDTRAGDEAPAACIAAVTEPSFMCLGLYAC